MTALFVKPRLRALGGSSTASTTTDRARTPAKAWRDTRNDALMKKQEQNGQTKGASAVHVAVEDPAVAPQATADPSLLQGLLMVPVGYVGLVLFFKAYRGSICAPCSGIALAW